MNTKMDAELIDPDGDSGDLTLTISTYGEEVCIDMSQNGKTHGQIYLSPMAAVFVAAKVLAAAEAIV